MGEMSFADLLAIVAIIAGPGIALLWRFLAGSAAPYRRHIEELAAAADASQVLLSLGQIAEAKGGIREAEIRILGRVEFNRQVRRRPHAMLLAVGAWMALVAGFVVQLVRVPGVGWVAIGLACVSFILGMFSVHGIRKLVAATAPRAVQGYRELCRARRRGPASATQADSTLGTVGARR